MRGGCVRRPVATVLCSAGGFWATLGWCRRPWRRWPAVRNRKNLRPPNVWPWLRYHQRRQVEFAGEEMGVRQMRKNNGWYVKCLPGAARLRDRLFRAVTEEEVLAILAGYEEGLPENRRLLDTGNLLGYNDINC